MSTTRHTDTAGDSVPLSMAVIDAIAECEGVDAVDLEPPLYEVIDLDALNQLTAGDPNVTAIEVSFTYSGYEICIDSDRVIDVSPTSQ